MTNEEKAKQVQDIALVESSKLNDLFSEYKKASLESKRLEKRLEKYFNDQFDEVNISVSCYSSCVEVGIELPKSKLYESISVDEHTLMAIFESKGKLTIEDLFNVHIERVNKALSAFKNKDKCMCGSFGDFFYCERCGEKYCDNCCDCDSDGEHMEDFDVMLADGGYPVSFEVNYCQNCLDEKLHDLIKEETVSQTKWANLDKNN
jgi:hypothetical protein